MIRKLSALAALLLGVGFAWQSAGADGPFHHARPACEPGYKIVEEIVYQDVVRTVCKIVPNIKTKWVYTLVDDPICIQETRHGQCPCCTQVCRRILVKKLVDDPCCSTTKCVTEHIVERVPVTVYRKVPCATTLPEAIPVKPAKKMP